MVQARPLPVVISGLALLSTAIAGIAQPAPRFGLPGLIASIGQSSDVAIVRARLDKDLKLGLRYKPAAQPSDLAGMRSLLLVVGASTKGLGAAGLDMRKEMARSRVLLEAAKAAGVPVMVLHTGGAQRRGKLTDDLASLVVPEADLVVVVAGGNRDGLFHKLAARRRVPVVEVQALPDVSGAVRSAFSR